MSNGMRMIAALSVLALTACTGVTGSEAGEPDERPVSELEPITNGITVTQDTIGTAWVLSKAGGVCTGTILVGNWLLTAGHCVTTNDASAISVGLLNGSNSPTGVGVPAHHPDLDVALVRLNAAPLDATGQPVYNRLYPGNVLELVSKRIYTQGWGDTTITGCVPPSGTGAGNLLTYATQTVAAKDPWMFFAMAVNGRGAWKGDSGSSLYQPVNGFYRPIGVESESQCTDDGQGHLAVASSTHSRADYIRPWVLGVIGNAPTVGTPAGYERGDGVSAIVYPHPTTGEVKEVALVPGAWVVTSLNAATNSPVTATSEVSSYLRGDSASTVVYRGSDGHVREFALSGGHWRAADLSGGGTPVASGSRPAGYVRTDGYSIVVYRGSDNHIHELYQNADGSWSNGDLTAISGAPIAAGDPIGYVRADGVNAVVYRSSAARVIELLLGSTWTFTDLLSKVGATDTGRAVAAGPRPYTRSDGVTAVVYVDTHSTIQELSLVGGAWGISSLASRTGTSTNFATPYVRADGIPAIVYVNWDGHVREAALKSGSWSVTDITAMTGAPLPRAPLNGTGSIVNGYVRGNDRASTIVYQTSNYHLIEIGLWGGSWYWSDLTTAAGGI